MKALILLVSIFLIISCDSLQYQKQIDQKLPQLGTIGTYRGLLLENVQVEKTILSLKEPIALKAEKIEQTKRNLFKKDSLPIETKTSVILSIIDKLSVINQINDNKQLLENLKLTPQNRVVTQIVIQFPNAIENSILQADEVYLVQEKEMTLSLQLRNNNKVSQTISFSEGTITDYKASKFCWGKNSRNKIEMFDLVPANSSCGEELYNSATKAKKKTEFKF